MYPYLSKKKDNHGVGNSALAVPKQVQGGLIWGVGQLRCPWKEYRRHFGIKSFAKNMQVRCFSLPCLTTVFMRSDRSPSVRTAMSLKIVPLVQSMRKSMFITYKSGVNEWFELERQPSNDTYLSYTFFKAEICFIHEHFRNVLLGHDNFHLMENINDQYLYWYDER